VAFCVFGRLILLEGEAPDLAWVGGAKGRRPRAQSSRFTLSGTSKCARGSRYGLTGRILYPEGLGVLDDGVVPVRNTRWPKAS
jgi:hypothetical protein